MNSSGALWSAAPGVGAEETQTGLRLLENSQALLRTILLGVALQYRSLTLESCRLLGQETAVDPKSLQAAASLITLCALLGFQQQAEELASQGGSPMEVQLGAVSILVGLIRLFLLLGAQGQTALEESAAAPTG